MYSSHFKVSSGYRCALKVVSTVSYISMYSQIILLYKVAIVPGFTMEMACDILYISCCFAYLEIKRSHFCYMLL